MKLNILPIRMSPGSIHNVKATQTVGQRRTELHVDQEWRSKFKYSLLSLPILRYVVKLSSLWTLDASKNRESHCLSLEVIIIIEQESRSDS